MTRLLVLLFALLVAAPHMSVAGAVESASAGRERRLKEASDGLKKGLDLLNEQKYDEAIVELTRAVDNERALSPENRALARYARGLAYFNKKDCAKAMEDFAPLAEARANDGQYHYIRYVCLDQAGDKPGAAAALDKAVEVTPDKVDFVRVRCINRFNAKDFANAIPDCEKVVAAKPDDADIWLAIGQSAEMTNQKDKALNAYRKLLALKPDSKPAQDGIKRMGG
jgi:tetratricopeptide (TPR) repeat protein